MADSDDKPKIQVHDLLGLNKKEPKPRPIGRPSKYDPAFCEMLLDHMWKGNSFQSFAAELGVSIDTIYEWAKVHTDFSESKKQGQGFEIAYWERILRGGAQGSLKDFSATATIFALKNKAPAFYRDKIHVDANPSMDKTKEEMHDLLQNDEYRAAALVIAEATAKKKKHDEPAGE